MYLVQRKVQNAYKKYLADILGVRLGDGEETYGFTSKKLFCFMKNSRQDNHGVSTLKDSETNLHTENVKKANLLNSQFQSCFSCLSPLRLEQLCAQSICDFFFFFFFFFFFKKINPDSIKLRCPFMPEISIDLNGVIKLLSNLKPHKALGRIPSDL